MPKGCGCREAWDARRPAPWKSWAADVDGTWGVDRGEGASAQPVAVRPTLGVGVAADDLAAVLDVEGPAARGARDVDRLVGAVGPEEAVDRAAGIGVEAHDPAPVVDAMRLRDLGAGDIDRGEVAVPVAHEAVTFPAGVDVGADDLAAVVDAEGEGQRGAGGVESDEATPLVAQKAMKRRHPGAGIRIEAHEFAAVIGGEVRGGRRSRDVLEGGENALAQEQVAACCGRRMRASSAARAGAGVE